MMTFHVFCKFKNLFTINLFVHARANILEAELIIYNAFVLPCTHVTPAGLKSLLFTCKRNSKETRKHEG